ncbi:hypothetical protein ACFFGT_00645 [Mucilaginibacter angelicae]|uniref:Uncharacterized protein n=1 Tax=Mucilaginibacter angelicae TaxID=869718 RepID=A0ABV6L2C2_9SPHI
MASSYRVIGLYNTSIGTILVVKLPDINAIPDKGAVLRNSSNSRWRITGIGMGKKPDFKNPHNDDLLIRDYLVEYLSGANSLNDSDILFIEQ